MNKTVHRCGHCGQLYPLEDFPPEQCPKREKGLPHAMGIIYLKHLMNSKINKVGDEKAKKE